MEKQSFFSGRRERKITEFLFLVPTVVAFIMVIIIPFIIGIYYSFTDWDGVNAAKNVVGLVNYKTIFTEPAFLHAFLVTLEFTVLNVIAVNVVAFLMALLVTSQVKGRNLENGLPKTVKLSSNELIEAFVEPMNHILDAIHAVLERTPPQLVGDLDKNGIILSGGGSLIYGIDRLIERSTGIRTIVVDDPISCAAYGAGKMLKNLDTMQDGMMNFFRMRQLKG